MRRLRRRLSLGLPALALLAIAVWGVTTRASTPAGATAIGMVGAVQNDGGLRLALTQPPGPYFRDELLPMTVTLTNNTAKPIQYLGALNAGPCGVDALDVTLMERGQFVAPLSTDSPMPSCPRPHAPLTTLKPGSTLRTRVLLGLPVAGRLNVMGQASFPQTIRVTSAGLIEPGGPLDILRPAFPALFRSAHAPFARGWPRITVDVGARIPPDKALHLARYGHTVYLRGRWSQARMRILQPVAQQAAVSATAQGEEWALASPWTPLAPTGLTDPGGGGSEKWEVLVGAPGYAIAHAVYCYNPAPNAVFGGVPAPRAIPWTDAPRSCADSLQEAP